MAGLGGHLVVGGLASAPVGCGGGWLGRPGWAVGQANIPRRSRSVCCGWVMG